MNGKWLKTAGVILAVLGASVVVTLASSPYLRRWALLRGPDVYDYERLPARTVPRGPEPLRLPAATTGDWLAALRLAHDGHPIARQAALDDFLAEHETTAFIVVKDGRLLAERYFNGFARDSLFKSFSISKSVLSALIGIALAEGRIESLDDPVTKYLPEMRDPAFARATLRHCLDGTAGIRYARGYMPWVPEPRMYYTTDVRGYLLGAVIEREPGQRFAAENLSPLVLGYVLERALARDPSVPDIATYLSGKLWGPLGAEYDARWNLDRERGGLEKTESGLSARAIDLTKFAVLYLQGGRWGSRQLVPAAWVAESTTMDADERAPNQWESGFFKHQWWGRTVAGPGRPDFYANGHFGQRLYVSPRKNLVLVRMGRANAGVDWEGFLADVARAF